MDGFDSTPSWARAYLEWMDLAAANPASGGERAGAELRRLDVFQQAMLLMASRTEADCLEIAEALRRAERLLEDERGAWQALSALRGCDRRRSRSATAGFPGGWQEELDGVAADIHALAARVLALQSGARARP